jgi:hypothetical protein
MMRILSTVITAPTEYRPDIQEVSLFLAGGITGCPDWQSWMVERLARDRLVLLNPRRPDFPIHDPSAAPAQIAWEHRHLRLATGILFWFCAETLNPIVLYELGAWSMMDKPLFVGVHPAYARRQDVELQTRLVRRDIQIVYSLEALAAQACAWGEVLP